MTWNMRGLSEPEPMRGIHGMKQAHLQGTVQISDEPEVEGNFNTQGDKMEEFNVTEHAVHAAPAKQCTWAPWIAVYFCSSSCIPCQFSSSFVFR